MGPNFEDIMAKCKDEKSNLPEEDIWEYIFQITSALKCLHDIGIVHREI